jgi:hypothetical protein
MAGAWLGGAASSYAFPAEMFVRAGAHYAALDFVGVKQAGGDLGVMADQVRRAIAWVYKNAEQFGGDRSRLYVGGHSSGGHLCGVAAITDWIAFGLPANPVRGWHCMSGMFDMKPVRLSNRSSYIKVHRRDGSRNERRAAYPEDQCADGAHLRHQRDAGIPASRPRLRPQAASGRQGRANRQRAGLEPLRNVRKPR